MKRFIVLIFLNAIGEEAGQGVAAAKQATGKTLQVLENMADQEADALTREMEKKYGQ